MIAVRDLSKDYSGEEAVVHALRDVTFTIERGEFVSIMGPSGSGKSTLLHLLSFLDRPTSGTYLFNGKNVAELSDEDLARMRNKAVGFVFQAFNLLSRSSVYENVEIPLLYSGLPFGERRAYVEAAVVSVGLGSKIRTEAGRLSGGEKQRVAIARALVNNPDILFADEPTGNLDSASGLQVMKILESLNKEGRTVILVTHEVNTAKFAKRMLKIRDGRLESDEKIAIHINELKERLK
ncbi:MAG: ABC transporter ATP-binding protein [Patescibacteria group bacterium]